MTDGRFRGGTRGLMIGHVSPEAAVGGPIALIEEGDIVSVDVDAKALNLEVADDVLAAAPGPLDPATAAVHHRRPGEVRGARVVGGRGRGHERGTPAGGPRREDGRLAAMNAGSKPGLVGFRISATESTGLDWPRIDETWALAGELGVFDAGWMSDHVSDASRDRNGPAMESLTAIAALAHRVPGKWVGLAVAANTFRHPALLAKSATVIDNVTGGRFVLGLGAGWHAGEHEAFGIPLPPLPRALRPIRERPAGPDARCSPTRHGGCRA